MQEHIQEVIACTVHYRCRAQLRWPSTLLCQDSWLHGSSRALRSKEDDVYWHNHRLEEHDGEDDVPHARLVPHARNGVIGHTDALAMTSRTLTTSNGEHQKQNEQSLHVNSNPSYNRLITSPYFETENVFDFFVCVDIEAI